MKGFRFLARRGFGGLLWPSVFMLISIASLLIWCAFIPAAPPISDRYSAMHPVHVLFLTLGWLSGIFCGRNLHLVAKADKSNAAVTLVAGLVSLIPFLLGSATVIVIGLTCDPSKPPTTFYSGLAVSVISLVFSCMIWSHKLELKAATTRSSVPRSHVQPLAEFQTLAATNGIELLPDRPGLHTFRALVLKDPTGVERLERACKLVLHSRRAQGSAVTDEFVELIVADLIRVLRTPLEGQTVQLQYLPPHRGRTRRLISQPAYLARNAIVLIHVASDSPDLFASTCRALLRMETDIVRDDFLIFWLCQALAEMIPSMIHVGDVTRDALRDLVDTFAERAKGVPSAKALHIRWRSLKILTDVSLKRAGLDPIWSTD